MKDDYCTINFNLSENIFKDSHPLLSLFKIKTYKGVQKKIEKMEGVEEKIK